MGNLGKEMTASCDSLFSSLRLRASVFNSSRLLRLLASREFRISSFEFRPQKSGLQGGRWALGSRRRGRCLTRGRGLRDDHLIAFPSERLRPAVGQFHHDRLLRWRRGQLRLGLLTAHRPRLRRGVLLGRGFGLVFFRRPGAVRISGARIVSVVGVIRSAGRIERIGRPEKGSQEIRVVEWVEPKVGGEKPVMMTAAEPVPALTRAGNPRRSPRTRSAAARPRSGETIGSDRPGVARPRYPGRPHNGSVVRASGSAAGSRAALNAPISLRSAGDIGHGPGTQGRRSERARWRGHPCTAKARAPAKASAPKAAMATALRGRLNRQIQQEESQPQSSKS